MKKARVAFIISYSIIGFCFAAFYTFKAIYSPDFDFEEAYGYTLLLLAFTFPAGLIAALLIYFFPTHPNELGINISDNYSYIDYFIVAASGAIQWFIILKIYEKTKMNRKIEKKK